MTEIETVPPAEQARGESLASRVLRIALTERIVLLAVLLVVVVVWFRVLGAGGYLVAPYDLRYLGNALESMVPFALLAVAELYVIVSGRGGIDLSVGAIVSLAGMVFGLMVGVWGWPVLPSIVACIVVGGLLGAVNGALVAYLRFPALIATLATYYAYSSLALVSNANAPVSTPPVVAMHGLTRNITLPLLPPIPLHVFTILLPCAVLAWVVLSRSTYGRSLYAVGTNDIAAGYATVSVSRTRFTAYVVSGLLSGVVALVTVAQFASARPDAGTVGNGMALPAITVAVLGGVAIQGGIGRVGGVLVAALLVTWLNAGMLLAFPEGAEGSRYQLLALGLVLVLSALLNTVALRRYGRLS
ncbi:ABC transporter permease [Pseudonocardia cypriaca]|uniref:Ribose transport system permease protein/erythritol transport system permease protein n=1 Tax=Pseudonocardia cypriaca TaxID=882449 RepID=A0A543FR35_9PSEU|nr:ABC transporter permease [Pseudonocardia cypriaca]TQM36286.1 ribose transport system permease protein/erythritol transport system permease protein [Pseudonocardia cypriaca]